MLNWKQLSQCQLHVLQDSCTTYYAGSLVPHLRMPMPLIVGPSGSGKTAVAQLGAAGLLAKHRAKHPHAKAATLPLCASSWVVRGSSNHRNTIQVIVNKLWSLADSPDSLLVIVLDEIDKLMHTTSGNQNSAWFTSVMQEVQELVGLQTSLLEGVTPEESASQALPAFDRSAVMRRVYQNTFIFAAGAFQGGFTSKQSLGFHGAAPAWDSMPDHKLFDHFRVALRFDDNDLQLFSRFRWHMLPPPTSQDLMQAAEQMIRGDAEDLLRPGLPEMVEQAAVSGTPYRTLESMIFEACVRLAVTRQVPPLADPITARNEKWKVCPPATGGHRETSSTP